MRLNIKGDKLVGESTAPCVHTAAKMFTKSGNYGIANEARKLYPNLCNPNPATPEVDDRKEAEQRRVFFDKLKFKEITKEITNVEDAPKLEEDDEVVLQDIKWGNSMAHFFLKLKNNGGELSSEDEEDEKEAGASWDV